MTIFLILLAMLALLAILIITLVSVEIKVERSGGEGKPILQELDLAQMDQIRRSPLTVYVSPGHQNLGKEVAEVLERAWRIVRERLDLDLGRFRVAVVVPKEEIGGISLKRRIWTLWYMIAPILTSPNLQSLHQADRDTLIAVYWVMAHEAMELKIFKRLYHDPANRWIGDGLAEYLGYVITSELAPTVLEEALAGRRRSIQRLLDQGQRQYDLTKEFLVTGRGKPKPAEVTAAGYVVALAFWLQIAQRHGEGVIKVFWQRLSQRRFPSAKEAAQILSELTGEDVWRKLQRMDLLEVLRTLEQAVGP